MWDKLKKAFHNVKAMVSGTAAYIATLFTTPGTFVEANAAAQEAYTTAYNRSMGRSRPSLEGVGNQVLNGDLNGAAQQTANLVNSKRIGIGRKVQTFLNKAANSLEDMEPTTRSATHMDFKPDAKTHPKKTKELASKQQQRHVESATKRNGYRDKYDLSRSERDDAVVANSKKHKSSSFRESVEKDRNSTSTSVLNHRR